MTESNLGLFCLQNKLITVHHEGKSGQEFKTGTQRQKLKQEPRRKKAAYWLVYAAHSVFNGSQDNLLRDGTVHNRLGLSTAIINQENIPRHLLTSQFETGSFKIEVPSSQIILVSIKLGKTTTTPSQHRSRWETFLLEIGVQAVRVLFRNQWWINERRGHTFTQTV